MCACGDEVDSAKEVRYGFHAEKKLLVTALKGLHAAYNIKREIPDVPLKGVQPDLTMTLPPRVGVSFVNNVVAAA